MELVKKILPNRLKNFWGEGMEDYRIVVDQSTSGTKVLLFNTFKNIELIDRIDKTHKQIYPHKGWVEHDPYEIISNVKELIDQMIQKHKLDYTIIKSLSITNQRESVVVWDKKTGKIYTNVMVWQCNRGLDICNQLIEEGFSATVQEKTGLKIDPYFSASKLKWFFDNNYLTEKELGNIAIGTMDSWLLWNLTDKDIFLTDISNASRTLLFDIHSQKWDDELCNIFNVPITAFPQVVNSVSNFGNYKSIPIRSILADSQAALYGHNCHKYGEIKATLGTGSSVMVNVGEKIYKSNNILTTIAWKDNSTCTYALEGIIKSYSDNLNWLQNELSLFSDIVTASEKAFTLETSGNIHFTPALEGLSAPFWKPGTQASFKGLTRDTTKYQLLRAVFEAMAFQTRAVIDDIEEISGISIERINVDGGPIKNKYFMQLLSDVTNKKIIVGELEEISALGALNIYLKRRIEAPKNQYYIPSENYNNQYRKWLKNI